MGEGEGGVGGGRGFEKRVGWGGGGGWRLRVCACLLQKDCGGETLFEFRKSERARQGCGHEGDDDHCTEHWLVYNGTETLDET